MKAHRERSYNSTLSLTSALDAGGNERQAPAALPPERDWVPIAWEAGWGAGPIWTGTENRDSIFVTSCS
jgi:hypothetical protein